MTDNRGFGDWWITSKPDQTISGELEWEALHAPTLTLLNPPVELLRMNNTEGGPPGERFVPMLHGMLSGSGAVTLVGCHERGFQIGETSTYRFFVDEVLIGIWLSDPAERFARRVEIELPILEAVLGPHPIGNTIVPSDARDMHLSLDERAHTWTNGEHQIEVAYHWLIQNSALTTTVNMRPVVTLTSRYPKSLAHWRDQWLEPLNRLLQIASGSKSNPTKVEMWQKKHLSKMERHERRVVLRTGGVGPNEHSYFRHQILVTIDDLREHPSGLPGILESVNELKTEHEVFIDLLTGVIAYQDRPLTNLFLDVVASLEAFHSHKYGMGPIPVSAFKTARRAARQAIRDASVEKEHERFIDRWMPTRPFHPLQQRLLQLMKAVSWENPSPAARAEELAQLRNDVAHGNAPPDYWTLKNAYDDVLQLARKVALNEVGFSAQ
jgi:hypothetical protein